VHALGGAWGALASGIFAVALGSGIDSNAQQVVVQLQGIIFVAVFAPLATAGILSALKVVFGSLRVSDEDEVEGLDLSQHSESAYAATGGGHFEDRMHVAAASAVASWQLPGAVQKERS
jgi:Amt family ammonium transporter